MEIRGGGGMHFFTGTFPEKDHPPPLTRNSEQSLRTQQTPDVKKKFKNVFVWFVGFLYRSKNVFLTSGVCWETGNPHPNKSTILLPPPFTRNLEQSCKSAYVAGCQRQTQ